MLRKVSNSNENEVEVLRVPWCSQQEKSYYCFPYSLWMVIQYYKNIYPNELIKNSVPDLSIIDLARICKTDSKSGTRLNEQLINELNNKIPSLKFEMVYLKDTSVLKDIVVKKKCPAIIIYDCGYLLYKSPSKVAHAGVVIGIDRDSIYLNNPWLGAETEINIVEFSDCWEIEYGRVLLIKPYLQTNLNSETFENNADKTPD